ncbi:MAG: hypothetical protein ACOYN0_18805, partial [Phycisphaerales bacterium]
MKTLTSMVVLCAATLGMSAPLASAQSQTPAAEQLRPPTPGKQDADAPAALSMLIGVVVVGVVLTANLIASKRSHQ